MCRCPLPLFPRTVCLCHFICRQAMESIFPHVAPNSLEAIRYLAPQQSCCRVPHAAERYMRKGLTLIFRPLTSAPLKVEMAFLASPADAIITTALHDALPWGANPQLSRRIQAAAASWDCGCEQGLCMEGTDGSAGWCCNGVGGGGEGRASIEGMLFSRCPR